MPDPIAQIHDEAMSRYFNHLTMGEADSSYLNFSKSWLVKNKSGYLFPVIVKVVIFNEDPTYLATMKSDVSLKNYVYLICNNTGAITDISSSAINNLNLDINKLKRINPHLESLVNPLSFRFLELYQKRSILISTEESLLGNLEKIEKMFAMYLEFSFHESNAKKIIWMLPKAWQSQR